MYETFGFFYRLFIDHYNSDGLDHQHLMVKITREPLECGTKTKIVMVPSQSSPYCQKK